MSANQPVVYKVVVLTPYHSIDGELRLLGVRFSDYLNDRRESVIVLRNAEIARLYEPDRVIERNTLAAIPKEWVVVAFEPHHEAVPLAKRLFAYIKKQMHEVFLAMDGMEVRGTLHTVADLDIRKFLAGPPDPFIPITRPVITLYANERIVIKPDAILVNAHRIRYLAKIEAKPAPPTP